MLQLLFEKIIKYNFYKNNHTVLIQKEISKLIVIIQVKIFS